MKRKISDDAFALYWAMGHERSYRALADQLGVSKRAIVDKASAEDWAGRLQAIEADVKERVDATLKDELEQSQMRYRKILRAVEARAAQVIAEQPLRSCLEGIKAIEAAVKLERLLAGEPAERNEHTIAEVTRQEIDRFLSPVGEASDEEDW